MAYRVDNAVIMAAGLSSRFAPISFEKPKALITVRGEVLIERQIRQLHDRGIKNVIVVVGYRKEQFDYLQEKYNVQIVENPDYQTRNNHSSIYAAREYLANSYICSADNYFLINPFEREVEESYYAAMFAPRKTTEWCLETDEDGWITEVNIGGEKKWYMLGHVFWSEEFSRKFIHILEAVYEKQDTLNKLWEDIYREHIGQLNMKIRKYPKNQIYEFDSLDELREFDSTYMTESGSVIMQEIANELKCLEFEITNLKPVKSKSGEVTGVSFLYDRNEYHFDYKKRKLSNLGR